VLKKAGIVVVAAAAGLFALSPLAFAGESHKDWGHGHSASDTDIASANRNAEGLVNLGDVNTNVPINALNCDEVDAGAIPVDVKQITTPIAGALALLGYAETEQTTVTDNSCNNTQGASAVDTVSQNQR